MREDISVRRLIRLFLTEDTGQELEIVSPLMNDNGEKSFITRNPGTDKDRRVTFKIEEI